MSRGVLHIALFRLSAIITMLVIAGSLTSVRAMNHEAPMNTASDTEHVDDMRHEGTECTGNGCGLCGPSSREHLAEHCPDCLAQRPAAPETIRFDRRLTSETPSGPDTGGPDAGFGAQHRHSSPTARSGSSTRSPILRL